VAVAALGKIVGQSLKGKLVVDYVESRVKLLVIDEVE
jgi:hypothetical protein